ncbi:MAG: PfaD family polyunsaturated fatty acid/polyketide biosynthesis protein [Anaerolineaceae bacterium]|nr:PfaD family polyunsaturated fatty acid/polyketide biosynthesis protein [Anaerolineaceae bacterium]
MRKTQKIKNQSLPLYWIGEQEQLTFDPSELAKMILKNTETIFAIQTETGIGFTTQPAFTLAADGEISNVAAIAPAVLSDQFGDPGFLRDYGVRAAYYAGAMANGIASTAMVIALGKAGFMGSFGSGGLSPERIEKAIQEIQAVLPEGPYAFNLLNNPFEPAVERSTVDLYLKYNVKVVEAAAYIIPSESLVYYRVMGLSENSDGSVQIGNRVIAKVSRREVAGKFISPAPERFLKRLLDKNLITPIQAALARRVPLADDITAEADSGGHTDNRPLVCLLPSMLALRDELQEKYQYSQPVRIGIGGGISTPESVLAAFIMGAAYVVTGSINHASIEAETSDFTKQQLAKAAMTDVTMAPAADMFEMGVNVQVLKRGTMFAMRAKKLYDAYKTYNSIEEIPEKERQSFEKSIFKRSLDEVWADTVAFFMNRDPSQIEKANQDPKKKMALIFRWYLGMASRWSCVGEKGRETDYQVWCGPAMGTFNDWVRGTYLEALENRHVVDMAEHLMRGCAYRYRLQNLQTQGIKLNQSLEAYHPNPL